MWKHRTKNYDHNETTTTSPLVVALGGSHTLRGIGQDIDATEEKVDELVQDTKDGSLQNKPKLAE